MAMSTSWPDWNEGDEFRGVREQACRSIGQRLLNGLAGEGRT